VCDLVLLRMLCICNNMLQPRSCCTSYQTLLMSRKNERKFDPANLLPGTAKSQKASILLRQTWIQRTLGRLPGHKICRIQTFSSKTKLCIRDSTGHQFTANNRNPILPLGHRNYPNLASAAFNKLGPREIAPKKSNHQVRQSGWPDI